MGSSLTKFVKAECACWTGWPEEECLGVDVFSDPFREPGKCWVLKRKACWYFKDCVLGPEDYKYPHLCFVKDPAFEKRVRSEYRKIDTTVVEADARRCPDCGAALIPRQRFCGKCRNKRRQQSYRNSRPKRNS
ncbi:MAG: hypothetical protein ACYSU6_04675 [Planctomycetota bacterium]